VSAQFRAWGARASVTRTVVPGDVVEFAARKWSVHHRPGHSPSDTVFFDEAAEELIGGDHLIQKISSNPLIARPLDGSTDERPQALRIYLESLAKTREMPLRRVWAGHGEPVDDHVAVIDERFRLHARRAEKLHGLISERPRSAYELAQAMWGNVAVTQAYLTLSEVLGHTDLLRNDGRVVEVEDDGVVRFEAA
jgi:glyoxylase-like metal-dependent hydrolase (beta-lactamase superfamily II)